MENTQITLFDRKSSTYIYEKTVGKNLLEFVYTKKLGKIGLELLLKRKLYSSLTGWFCDLGISKFMINNFIKNYDIDMTETLLIKEDYKSFNEFFFRKLKTESRIFDMDSNTLSCPGDGRLKAWENINKDSIYQIKGFSYSLGELLGDKILSNKYNNGTCILLRLAPVDYHRFHFIDSGICDSTIKLNGDYYSVNPIALSNIDSVFCKNKREYCIFQSDNFGDIVYVEVGATSVGSIVQTFIPRSRIEKGDEKGYFKFGGSTIVLFFQKNTIKIDTDILTQTELGYETKVIAGESIGKKV
jgi:phosphatidylserine decarboxylase